MTGQDLERATAAAPEHTGGWAEPICSLIGTTALFAAWSGGPDSGMVGRSPDSAMVGRRAMAQEGYGRRRGSAGR